MSGRLTHNKIMHSASVAQYMSENATKYGLDREKMYVLGLLHDIGYLFGQRDHAEDGANLLNQFGLTETKYANFIALHDTNPFELRMQYDGDHISPVLFLLQQADMTVDALGNFVGFDKRLKEIGRRYGENSKAYETAKAIVEYQKGYESHYQMSAVKNGVVASGEKPFVKDGLLYIPLGSEDPDRNNWLRQRTGIYDEHYKYEPVIDVKFYLAIDKDGHGAFDMSIPEEQVKKCETEYPTQFERIVNADADALKFTEVEEYVINNYFLPELKLYPKEWIEAEAGKEAEEHEEER